MNHPGTDLSMARCAGSEEVLVAFAQIAAFERDNWSPADPGGRGLWRFQSRFRHLLGNAKQMLAPFHLLPDIDGPHPGSRPQHGEVIKKVGALADHRFRV